MHTVTLKDWKLYMLGLQTNATNGLHPSYNGWTQDPFSTACELKKVL